MQLRVLQLLDAAERWLHHVLSLLIEQQLDKLRVDQLYLQRIRLEQVLFCARDLKLIEAQQDLAVLQQREGEIRHAERQFDFAVSDPRSDFDPL